MFYRIYYVNLLGSINQGLDSIGRSSRRFFFCRIFQLSPSSFDVYGFMFCLKYKRENPSHIFSYSLCCVHESFVRPRWLPSHILRVSKIQDYVKNLVIVSVVAFKSLKIHKRVYWCLLGIQERSSPWTRSCHVVVVVSFLLEVVIGC